MGQVSRPYQFALVAVVALMAVWLVALRPKADAGSSTPTPAPVARQAGGNAQAGGPKAVTSLGRAVERSRDGVLSSNAAEQSRDNAQNPVEASGSPSASSSPTATAPAAAASPASASAATPASLAAGASGVEQKPKISQSDLRTLPEPIVRAVNAHKVLVLLFFNHLSPDDRAVRRAVLSSSRHGGKVVVMTAPIAKLARFTAITRAVPVLGSPTVVVIDRKLNARSLDGFIDREGVDELISDAMRA
jgi:hypothetical protein